MDPNWDLVLKILAVAVPGIIGVLGVAVTFMNSRLNAQGQIINTISEGREQDRKDREELRSTALFYKQDRDQVAADLKKIHDEKTESERNYVALSVQHQETQRDLANLTQDHTDLSRRFERRTVEVENLQKDVQRLNGSLAEATTTISSMHNVIEQQRVRYDDDITRMNEAAMEKQSTLQAQIDKLTLDLRAAREEITQLHRQIQDFNSVNMNLADENQRLARQVEALIEEKAALQAELLTLKAPIIRVNGDNASSVVEKVVSP